jgi:hypothetical protein
MGISRQTLLLLLLLLLLLPTLPRRLLPTQQPLDQQTSQEVLQLLDLLAPDTADSKVIPGVEGCGLGGVGHNIL